MSVVLQEYLVNIAVRLDPQAMNRALAQIPQGITGNQQRTNAAAQVLGARIGTVLGNAIVVSATSAVRDLQNLFASMTRIAERAARSITYSVIGAATNFGILAHRLDELHAVSERTGASASNIKALDLAIRMIGGTSGDASGAIEGLANAMRENPGVRNYLRGLGVTETKDTVRMVEQLSSVLRRDTESTAIQRGAVLGLSPEAVRLIRDGRLVGQVREARAIFQSMGVDYDRLAKDGKTWTDQWRVFLTYVDAFNSKFMGAFLRSGFLTQINQLIKDFGGPLSDALAEFGKSVVTFLDENANGVIAWLRDKDTPKRLVDAFKEMKNFAIEIKDAIVEVARVARELYEWITGKKGGVSGDVVKGLGGAGQSWGEWLVDQVIPAPLKRMMTRNTGSPAGDGGGVAGGGGGGGGSSASQGGGIAGAFAGRPKWMGGTGEGIVKGFQGTSGVPAVGGSSLKAVIDNAAAKEGIDPRIMYGIVAGESGHGNNYDANTAGRPFSAKGQHGDFGPFQLNRFSGLGVDFKRDTGKDVIHPSTIPDQAAWVAKFIKEGGSLSHWVGYKGRRDWNPSWGSAGYVPPKQEVQTAAAAPTASSSPLGGLKVIGEAAAAGIKSFQDTLPRRSVATTRFAPDGSPIRDGASGFDVSRFDAAKGGRGFGDYDFSKAKVVSPSSVNDNSKKIEFKPQYNTDIYATDPKQAATSFQRAHEQMNDMGLRQLGGWSR